MIRLDLQGPGVSKRHERLLAAGDRLGVHFGVHGADKRVRGWNLLIISDVKSGLTLWAKLVPANHAEVGYVCQMLRELLFDLETRFGLHFAMPPRGEAKRDWNGAPLPWADTAGVPHCAHCGPMRIHKREGWDHKSEDNPLRWDKPYIEDTAQRRKLCAPRCCSRGTPPR